MPRLFICVEVSELSILKEIDPVLRQLSLPGVKPVKSNQLHITLKFIGETPDESISSIKSGLAKVEFTPFSISLNGLGCFPNLNYIRVVWIGIQVGQPDLTNIANQVRAAIDSLGFPREKRPFSPHLTLARVKKLGSSEKQTIHTLIQDNQDISFGKQTIDAVILKKSTLTPKGPVYEDIITVKGIKTKE
ncbi:MAG: RNA 2',3'-cyclic phosphodiesterase [Candidatus Heimdallarchaeota archaeon]